MVQINSSVYYSIRKWKRCCLLDYKINGLIKEGIVMSDLC